MQKKGFKKTKIQSLDKLIFGHLNIIFFQIKFEALKYTICRFLDLHLIFETKMDDYFHTAQFLIRVSVLL